MCVPVSCPLLTNEVYPPVAGMGHTRGDMVIEIGMSFAYEPSCGFGPHAVILVGSVVVGTDGPIELNLIAAHLLRVN